MAEKLFEVLSIGDEKIHLIPEVAFLVEYSSKRNIDKKVASGSDDAVATDKGRHVRDLSITMSWPDVPRINKIVGPTVKSFCPGGPDGGKPWEWSHVRNGLDLGDLNAVRSIMFEEAEGPNVDPGSGVCVVKYKATSWSKPTAKAGAGKTPDEKDKQKAADNPYGAVFEPTPAAKIAEKPPAVKP